MIGLSATGATIRSGPWMRVLSFSTNVSSRSAVMAGHSRPKDGVASLAYVPAIHATVRSSKGVDARHKAGHDVATWEANLAKLKVMCARSMHVAVGALGQAFATASGHD